MQLPGCQRCKRAVDLRFWGTHLQVETKSVFCLIFDDGVSLQICLIRRHRHIVSDAVKVKLRSAWPWTGEKLVSPANWSRWTCWWMVLSGFCLVLSALHELEWTWILEEIHQSHSECTRCEIPPGWLGYYQHVSERQRMSLRGTPSRRDKAGQLNLWYHEELQKEWKAQIMSDCLPANQVTCQTGSVWQNREDVDNYTNYTNYTHCWTR